jgi:hypothetical protein
MADPALVFVILTMQKNTGPDGSTTLTWVGQILPDPASSRRGVFKTALAQFPEEYRNGAVLFFSAEPMQLAVQQA